MLNGRQQGSRLELLVSDSNESTAARGEALNSSVAIHDCPFDRRRESHIVRWLASILLASSFFIITQFGLAWVPLLIVLIWLPGVLYWMRNRKRTADAIHAASPDPASLAGTLRSLVPHEASLSHAARLIAGSGVRGIVLRFYHGDPPPTVEPLEFPFEPYPLGAFDRSIEELASEQQRGAMAAESEKRTRRALGLLCVPFVILPLLTAGVTYWRGLALQKIVLICFLPSVAGIGLILFLLMTARRVYLIPAGLVEVRRRPALSWPVHRFVAAESVLLLCRNEHGVWSWGVADGARAMGGGSNELTTDALLRAWLSPVRPPSVEMIRGLAGE